MMVQEPSDAKFDGMPNATLAVSTTHYILPAKALPGAIQEYVHGDHEENSVPVIALKEEFLFNIVKLIKEQFPFDFTNYKLPTLVRRINRRMLHHDIKDENRFFSFLKKNPAEIELLINDFLIGVTSFFRDPEAFNVLENDVIPQIIEQKSGNDYIKIWVASCATGEEAYSMAILVKEYLIKNQRDIDVKIFASDINKTALDQAAKGVFTTNIEKTVSNERLNNFFDKDEDSYKIKPEIRKMLIFARHDLTKNPPYCDVDLISCRNMLIYIKPSVQNQIIAKLGFGLRKNGFLFLGSSENLSFAKDDFIEISTKWKIYQSILNKRRFDLNSSFTAPLTDLSAKFIEAPVNPKISLTLPALIPEMSEVILNESGFCGVSIDADGRVLQPFGDLSRYVKAGRFNFNLQELLPETLAIAFMASLHQAVKLNQRVRINNIEFTEPESLKISRVDMIISPYRDKLAKLKGLMVLFKPVSDAQAMQHEGEDFRIDVKTKEYIAHLEEDVHQLKQDLFYSNENLEQSKEAMQAYNEELLSANEEMQSANEELQSINEELETVNAEHKYTINELTNLNDDLNNYFRSNINGQLFVDRDILLKKYSPGAVKHINIRESDIGRPLSNITTNIKFETLTDDIKKVMNDGQIIVQEIESKEGNFYQVTTSPYLRKNDKEIFGAIITFYDISELKRTQTELNKTNKMLSLATVAAEMGTWSIDVESRELMSSPRLKEIFGFQTEGLMSLSDALDCIVDEHRSVVLDAIDTAITNGIKLELEFLVHDIQGNARWVRAIGNLTYNNDGGAEFLTGIMHDVTTMREADQQLRRLQAQQQQEILQITLNTQEEERRRISESLHNGVGQLLYGTRLAMNYLSVKTAIEDPEKFNASKDYAANLLTESIKDIRRISHELMPTVLAEFGLEAAVKDVCEQLQGGIRLKCHVSLAKTKLDDYLELAVFRTVQELMLNIVKHAGATIAEVNVSIEGDEVLIVVSDNGQGMKAGERDKTGVGLSSIHNKVELLKGSIGIQSSEGKGTVIKVLLPIRLNEE
jgi:two-component system CheB/CheR fusion protein